MLVALVYVGFDLVLLGTPEAGNVIAASFVVLLWYIGRRLRFRGEYLRLLEERAVHLERERSVEAERAVAQERTRIARELLDMVVIAHAAQTEYGGMFLHEHSRRPMVWTAPSRVRLMRRPGVITAHAKVCRFNRTMKDKEGEAAVKNAHSIPNKLAVHCSGTRTTMPRRLPTCAT